MQWKIAASPLSVRFGFSFCHWLLFQSLLYQTSEFTLVAEPVRSGLLVIMATSNLASQELHINHKLPTWNVYRLQVELETDGTATDDLAKLGPRLVRNLTHKAWECCSEIDREKLKKADGVEYLLSYLESKRGKQKVDLLGDALSAA